jgi:inosine/xanthosine triphosphatase
MEVVVGSNNYPKRLAVETVFKNAFPDEFIYVKTVSVDSGVASHPINAEDALQGAINRAQGSFASEGNAQYYVGIEGGLLRVKKRAWEIGWVAISNDEGYIATALSAGIELKGQILEAILDGKELNDVLDDVYGIAKIGNSNGFYGLATNDLVTRQAAYEQGITFALAPFLHPELY